MGKWDGLNRRKFPRVNYPCLVTVKGDNKDSNILTHTENVGAGGVCIIIKQSLKMFSTVDVELDLLDMQEHIKCAGKVVWNVKRKSSAQKKPSFYDIGVEFVDIKPNDKKHLDEAINRLVKNYRQVLSQ